jgi:hypothetical protein
MSIRGIRLACLRSYGSSAIAVWLVVQLAGFTAPIILLASSVIELCTCPDTDGATCPMHHHNTGTTSARPGPTPDRCAVQNAHAPGMVVPLSLGVTAVVPTTARLGVPVSSCALMPAMCADPLSRTRAPDPLPPR